MVAKPSALRKVPLNQSLQAFDSPFGFKAMEIFWFQVFGEFQSILVCLKIFQKPSKIH